MAKILTITISDDAHAKMEVIKKRCDFNNNAELLEYMINEISKSQAVQEAKA